MKRTADTRPFTALQYYLAHARNRVHLTIGLPHAVAPTEFRALVADIVAAAPQLLWQESLELGGHQPGPVSTLDELIDHRVFVSAEGGRERLMPALSKPLNDTGRSAFRAICHTATEPGSDGMRSWIAFQTTHALMEGGDIASILRGRGSVHDARPIVDSGLGPIQQLAAAVLPVVMWGLHLLAAATEKRDPQSFAFLHATLNRQDLTATARRLGVSQRALVFGLVAHALLGDPARKRPVPMIYSTLPSERARLCDDEFLNLRMDELRVKLGADAEADIQATAKTLAARGPSPMFVQTWQRRLNQWHQHLHRRVPGLYPRRFFGFAPYEMVLSMVPPVDPARFSPLLRGARLHAGSNTGSVPTCIMVPTRDALTLTVWASPQVQERFDRLYSVASMLGIRCGETLDGGRDEPEDANRRRRA